jgi:hypothetical protein
MLSDVVSDSIGYEYSQGRLKQSLNFDMEGNILKYTKRGDTILIDILYMVEKRNKQVVPQQVELLNDTLNITLKSIPFQEEKDLGRFKFDILKLYFLDMNLERELVIQRLNL